jgi:UDP-glucose 4-epimerase
LKLLVTGGAGYIGSICVEQLLKMENKVVVIDNLQEGNRDAAAPDAEFIKGDYGDKKLLIKVFDEFKIEAVIHFAAETTIKESMTDPSLYFHNNLINGINLLDVMKEFACKKIIFSSTAAIFGEPEYTPIAENHPTNPINSYGESKLLFERVLDWYKRAYGLKFNTFRYFNAAGASEKYGECHRNESHLIPLLIKVALGQLEDFKLFGNDYPTKDRTCVRDYIHVIDIASAHILALDNLEKHPQGKYNLGNGEGFTNLEVLKMVESVSGEKIKYEFGPRRYGDPSTLIASAKKARQELGWRPKYPGLEDIVRSAWDWHKKYPRGYQ